VFFAADHAGLVALFFQAQFNLVADLVQQLLAITGCIFHRRLDAAGPHRVENGEAQVFEFHPYIVHAQAQGNWRVNIQGLPGDATALFRTQHVQRAHVVQAVGELDQDNADILGHGKRHFLEVFGLRFGAGGKVDLGKLADTVNQFGNRIAELPGERLLANAGILNDVVQERGDQALRIHVHVGEDAGHG
jgi:hypothetical protein